MKAISLCAAVLFTFSSGHAAADWQFTSWGQSPESLSGSGPHQLERTTAQERADFEIPMIAGSALLKGEYETPDFATDIQLYFRDDRLTGVRLKLHSPEDAMVALSRLKAQYGPSESGSDRQENGCQRVRQEWNDVKRGNYVSFGLTSCLSGFRTQSIIYTPIAGASDTGL